MSNFIQSLRVYRGKWAVSNSETITKADVDESGLKPVGTIVKSEYGSFGDGEDKYGLSLCMYFKKGGQCYMPLSINSRKVEIGDSIELEGVVVETLSREGDSDIKRACIK